MQWENMEKSQPFQASSVLPMKMDTELWSVDEVLNTSF